MELLEDVSIKDSIDSINAGRIGQKSVDIRYERYYYGEILGSNSE